MKRVAMFILGMGLIVGCSAKNPLEGRWVSDKEKTIAYGQSIGLPQAQIDLIEQLGGNVYLEVKGNRVTGASLDGSLEPKSSEAVYKNEGGVEQLSYSDGTQTYTYTVEGDCMWIAIPQLKEGMREYFCRVE
ncbi:hypothetical protein WEU38_11990 [Cyanobacterium aponinum AL20118]|uniref:Lipoprotein n=1 Tax=Cyanobacterium aponinum AL20115 TaxID=3090662 RepID=A0AAF1C0F5_9CHRO|nr:hypothetical protein [Cyanobacterium aponinum]WPF87532.1 hypothetical protein SAY89_12025 [Cyanobacterium aponinum AL20115]